ncbi:hypothetical protein ACFE04_003305 [Oxalis oulophora]
MSIKNIFAVIQIMVKKTTHILVNVRELAPTAALGAFCLLRKPVNNTTVHNCLIIVYVAKEEEAEITQAVPVETTMDTTSTSSQTMDTIVNTTSKVQKPVNNTTIHNCLTIVYVAKEEDVEFTQAVPVETTVDTTSTSSQTMDTTVNTTSKV